MPTSRSRSRGLPQRKLWHESGQAALETARVCVFGSSALASESLKNLVLPGIGEFTVVDDAVVGEQDTLTNFFVQPSDMGKPRAKCIVSGLSELNPDVRGASVIRTPAEVLASCEPSDTELVSRASLVIACGLPEAVVHDLGLRCWQQGTPLLVATAAGFMASVRTVVSEHAVVESHAEIKQDLRLTAPFPALLSFANTIDLSTLDPTDLGHVPFVVIIIKALQKWAADKNLALGVDPIEIPFRQLADIRNIVIGMAPCSDEENFVEASKNVNANCSACEIPFEVTQILSDPAAAEPKSNGMADDPADLKGMLPLSGTIPDMKADTKGYIALQRVYKQRADEDKAELAKHIRDVLQAVNLPECFITQGEVDTYCKNARRLRLLRFTPLHTEIKSGPASTEGIAYSEALFHYVLFRGSAAFYAAHARYPGAVSSNSNADIDIAELVHSDAMELETISNGLLALWGVADQAVPKGLSAEFARSGHDELHNVASMAGGVIAQEAIKLITHQYVPANNLCIIDGASGKIHVTKV
ncbi:hypothetical protein LPJ66_006876 [Kickxella alabastrina]|uniref:Uncharacterized protein n=1 Tax=Kickxella alabastrina TaxID=61397 RepID=A0ACC1IE63_9FUNG|nr:hypothetical protein LPJ66_006876 [Kickxella alabastrina]